MYLCKHESRRETIQIYFRRICIITEFSSHRTETLLFLSTNMAAVTSVKKRQFTREKFQFSRDRTAPVRPPLHESKKYEMPLSLYSAKNSMPCSFFYYVTKVPLISKSIDSSQNGASAGLYPMTYRRSGPLLIKVTYFFKGVR